MGITHQQPVAWLLSKPYDSAGAEPCSQLQPLLLLRQRCHWLEHVSTSCFKQTAGVLRLQNINLVCTQGGEGVDENIVLLLEVAAVVSVKGSGSRPVRLRTGFAQWDAR